MTTATRRRLLLAVVIVGMSACDGGPTGPSWPDVPEITAALNQPPTIDVTGSWTGTYRYDFDRGDTGPDCSDTIATAATITQTGAHVSGRLVTPGSSKCLWPPVDWTFDGVVRGSRLVLLLQLPGDYKNYLNGELVDDTLRLSNAPNSNWELRRSGP